MSPEMKLEQLKSMPFGSDHMILRTNSHLLIHPLSEREGDKKTFLQHSDLVRTEVPRGESILDGGFVRKYGDEIEVHGSVVMEGQEIIQGGHARNKTIKQIQAILKGTEMKVVDGGFFTKDR